MQNPEGLSGRVPGFVRGVQARQSIQHHAQDDARRHELVSLARARDESLERFAFHVIEHQVVTLVVRTRLVHTGDIRVVHMRSDARFVEKTLIGLCRELLVRALYGDQPFDSPRPHVTSEIHGAHATMAELEQDLVGANLHPGSAKSATKAVGRGRRDRKLATLVSRALSRQLRHRRRAPRYVVPDPSAFTAARARGEAWTVLAKRPRGGHVDGKLPLKQGSNVANELSGVFLCIAALSGVACGSDEPRSSVPRTQRPKPRTAHAAPLGARMQPGPRAAAPATAVPVARPAIRELRAARMPDWTRRQTVATLAAGVEIRTALQVPAIPRRTPAANKSRYYPDTDNDTFGAAAGSVLACSPPRAEGGFCGQATATIRIPACGPDRTPTSARPTRLQAYSPSTTTARTPNKTTPLSPKRLKTVGSCRSRCAPAPATRRRRARARESARTAAVARLAPAVPR